MAAITRLAVAHPMETEYPNGVEIYGTSVPLLASVIATNRSDQAQRFHIYIVPAGSEQIPADWGHLVYNLPISANNAYETFRVGLNPADQIFVAGSGEISYYVQGVTQ